MVTCSAGIWQLGLRVKTQAEQDLGYFEQKILAVEWLISFIYVEFSLSCSARAWAEVGTLQLRSLFDLNIYVG